MWNPARTLSKQFIRRSPTTLLGIGMSIALVDFVTLYVAASGEGVLYISEGVGLLNHYGIFSTVLGNAISLYAAKKYYEGVCSIRDSKAVVDNAIVEKPLKELTAMIELRGKYRLIMYLLVILGTLFLVS